jgi:hypothetical protein
MRSAKTRHESATTAKTFYGGYLAPDRIEDANVAAIALRTSTKRSMTLTGPTRRALLSRV